MLQFTVAVDVVAIAIAIAIDVATASAAATVWLSTLWREGKQFSISIK